MKMTLSIVLVMPSYLLKNEIKSKIKTTGQPKTNQPKNKQKLTTTTNKKSHHHRNSVQETTKFWVEVKLPLHTQIRRVPFLRSLISPKIKSAVTL